MQKFEITVLGCGSALPTVRHNGSAQVVNIRDKYFLIDCAEGTQLELRRNHIHLNRLFTIFISHLHGDHCFGLMGLISTLGLLGRTAPLHIYGPEDLERMLRPQIDYFCNGMDFEVIFHAIDTRINGVIYEDRSLTVETIPLTHRVACCGFLFREKPNPRHIRPEAIEHYQIPRSQINNIKAGLDYQNEDGIVIPNHLLTNDADPSRSFAYCSDTAFRADIAEIIKDADLLYHEATYSESEASLSTKYFHSTAKQAATIAQMANVRQLMIGHFSSRYEDEALLLQEAQSVFPQTILAKERLTVKL